MQLQKIIDLKSYTTILHTIPHYKPLQVKVHTHSNKKYIYILSLNQRAKQVKNFREIRAS